VHDLTAARIWGIVRELAAAGLIVLADKGYIGAGPHVLTPYRGRNKPASQKADNRAHAQLRAPGNVPPRPWVVAPTCWKSNYQLISKCLSWRAFVSSVKIKVSGRLSGKSCS
jgi:hypothetical protein